MGDEHELTTEEAEELARRIAGDPVHDDDYYGSVPERVHKIVKGLDLDIEAEPDEADEAHGGFGTRAWGRVKEDEPGQEDDHNPWAPRKWGG